MKFNELHATIPYVTKGKEKSIELNPYPAITLAMPGRHAFDTIPLGGDFVVMVTDTPNGWMRHQFTHTDIFNDVEAKREHDDIDFFMRAYLDVVTEYDPLGYSPGDGHIMPGIEFTAFMCASQCLAVAEHRRYKRYERQFGGRYLPFRFAAGIAEGLWSADDATGMQKKGRPGVEMLEKFQGVPYLTQELMK